MELGIAAAAALFACVPVGASLASDASLVAEVDLTAKLLAGVEVSGARDVTRSPEWKAHRSAMDRAWSSYEKSTLDPMATWSRQQVNPHLRSGGIVRYAFSGPDVLHVLRMFPSAGSYILCGLEPVGALPRPAMLRGRRADTALAEIRKILEESVRFSFFKTKDMRVELASASYRGTLPIMCLFLARSGFEITGIEFLELGQDGTLKGLGTGVANANAVRIDARSKRGGKKSIYYFRTNIADGPVSKSGFLAFLRSLPAGGCYLKAASYLMHNSYFSQIRSHLLDSSTVIVQDDSGIPLRHFNRSSWQLGFHGSYTTPIPLFSERYQKDLRQAYRSGARPLPFGTGYRWRKGDSNLLCAVRGGAPTAPRAVAVVRKALAVETQRDRPPQPPRPPAEGGVVSHRATLDLTLRLAATSELDHPAALGGKSAFVVSEYEILAVNRGPRELDGQRIRIATTRLLHGRPVPQRPLGAQISIRVQPLSSYPTLARWHVEDDLPKAEGAVLYIASQS